MSVLTKTLGRTFAIHLQYGSDRRSAVTPFTSRRSRVHSSPPVRYESKAFGAKISRSLVASSRPPTALQRTCRVANRSNTTSLPTPRSGFLVRMRTAHRTNPQDCPGASQNDLTPVWPRTAQPVSPRIRRSRVGPREACWLDDGARGHAQGSPASRHTGTRSPRREVEWTLASGADGNDRACLWSTLPACRSSHHSTGGGRDGKTAHFASTGSSSTRLKWTAGAMVPTWRRSSGETYVSSLDKPIGSGPPPDLALGEARDAALRAVLEHPELGEPRTEEGRQNGSSHPGSGLVPGAWDGTICPSSQSFGGGGPSRGAVRSREPRPASSDRDRAGWMVARRSWGGPQNLAALLPAAEIAGKWLARFFGIRGSRGLV